MKPAYARHRVDTTAKALAAEAERLGLGVEHIGGAIDAVCWRGRVVRLVDWKTPGGELTKEQARLVAKGVPITFVSTAAQVQALAAEMRREAGEALS